MLFPDLSTATFRSLNSGMYLVTGSEKDSLSSSMRSIATEMVTSLLIDQILIHVSPSTFRFPRMLLLVTLCSYTIPDSPSILAYRNG